MVFLELLNELEQHTQRGDKILIGKTEDIWNLPVTIDGAPAKRVDFIYKDNILVAVDIASE